MRHFRNLLYFIVGLGLAFNLLIAHAETIPATPTQKLCPAQQSNKLVAQGMEVCNSAQFCQQLYGVGVWSGGSNYVDCNTTNHPRVYYAVVRDNAGYICPSTGGWTLSGSSCIRPDCQPGLTRDETTGACVNPNCPMYDGTDKPELTSQPSNCSCPSGSAWVYGMGCRKTCGTAGQDANAGFDLNVSKGASSGCFGGCEVQHKSGVFYTFKDGSKSAPATYTGWACKGNGEGTAPTGNGQPEPDSKQEDQTKKHPPKCGAGEGVITSSSGNVLCLPGADNTSTPKVETTKKTETFPDNSTKTTETTKTTDPYTGASDTRSTSTSTGGQSGTAGTSTSTENNGGTDGDGDGQGDGDCDPSKDACGKGVFGENGDLYEPKYKDGLGALLTTKHNEMKGSPIFTLVGALAPAGLANSGTCPHWSFSGSVNSKISLGTMEFAPPCWVFDACRAILLVTSLLLARRLVFGG